MEDNRGNLLKEIQIAKFAVIEANLFLDTHPNDQEALKFFKKSADKLHDLMMEWEEKYGRVQNTADGQLRWAWVDNPWPWEMEG